MVFTQDPSMPFEIAFGRVFEFNGQSPSSFPSLASVLEGMEPVSMNWNSCMKYLILEMIIL